METNKENLVAYHFGYKKDEWDAKSELAKKAALYAYENYSGKEIGIAVGNAYIAGATEQREIDIQRAVEWLKSNADKYIFNTTPKFGDFSASIQKKMYDDFEKAIKGEEK